VGERKALWCSLLLILKWTPGFGAGKPTSPKMVRTDFGEVVSHFNARQERMHGLSKAHQTW